MPELRNRRRWQRIAPLAPLRRLILVCALATWSGCVSPSPTGPEIEDALSRQTEDALRSAAGPWWGVASDGGSLTLEFSVTQTPGGQLQGVGTMREPGAGPVPITVAGTYGRPNLALSFTGMVYDGRAVVGTFAAPYTSFTGVSGTLQLTGDNYVRSMSLLLQEGPPPPASLGGRVTDAVSGAPVVGATVSVQGRSVTSSVTGHYGFDPNLAAGTFQVIVTHASYAELRQDVEIAPYKIVDFRLQPK